MPNLWMVRAESGRYAEHFVRGGYAGLWWIPGHDLGQIQNREQIRTLYTEEHPEDASPVVVGNRVGNIARFLFEIQPGDYVATPVRDSDRIQYGQVAAGGYYYSPDTLDGCPFRHRLPVDWNNETIRRSELSVPFQNTLTSLLSVFSIRHQEEFLDRILGRGPAPGSVSDPDPRRVVLDRILQLNAAEFEILVGDLFAALGFEETEVVGKPGDDGVDVVGVLNASGLARVKVFAQVKRYEIGSRISRNTVRQLRQSIPVGGQGAFITTASFQDRAWDVAEEQGFPRIGLINGHQLVDLLEVNWSTLENRLGPELRERLGLRAGLVPD